VFKLGLADIVIDTQAPIILALTQWLESKKSNWSSKTRPKHVILETPEVQWFQSAKFFLKEMGGYEVIDTIDAIKLYGSAQDIPMLVCERTTQDTIHTVRRLVLKNITKPENVCALCSSHQGLSETRAKENGSVADDEGSVVQVTNICSSDLHDRLFRKVRHLAMRGHSKKEIQRQLDENLATLLEETPEETDWKLCLYL
jgi:hypothetical protein